MNISELYKKLLSAFPDAKIKQGDAYQDHVTIDFGGDHGFFVVMEDERDNFE
jgi:hypothetical protein